MSGLAGLLVEALVASTVLMILVLLLRTPVRRAFGPDVAYAMWALPALRLVLPPLPASWREIAAAPISAAGETITVYITDPLGGTAIGAAPGVGLADAAPVLAALWIVGSLAFLGWHAAAHLRFCRRMLDLQVRGSEIDGGIRLIETDAASGPLAFGVLRRYVAFPRDFTERYDQDERDLALAHELGHHARGDLIANWIALAVLALHWFNPVAWRAFRAFRADQEIANDARVLAGLPAMARHAYACAIVKSAHGPVRGGPVSAACHLHTINDLKGRLKMLTTNKTSRTRLIGGAAAIAALTVAGLGLTASGTQAAAAMRNKVQTAGLNLAALSVAAPTRAELPVPPQAAELPEPPAPPALPTDTGTDTGGDRNVSTTTTTAPDGKRVKYIRVVTHDKDGKVSTNNWGVASDDVLKNMPEVTSLTCPKGDARQMVINEVKDGKRRIVICADRIEAAAAQGAETAANSAAIQRNAMQTAMSGLRTARASVAGSADMPAAQRAEALKGIDEAIEEMTEEMGKAN